MNEWRSMLLLLKTDIVLLILRALLAISYMQKFYHDIYKQFDEVQVLAFIVLKLTIDLDDKLLR
jgi:hypothetical protein